MRWNAAGNAETGFRRRCFAVVDWALGIRLSAGTTGEITFDGEFDGKRVRRQELLKILEARLCVAARSHPAVGERGGEPPKDRR